MTDDGIQKLIETSELNGLRGERTADGGIMLIIDGTNDIVAIENDDEENIISGIEFLKHLKGEYI